MNGKEKLLNDYENINKSILNEVENLKYLLDSQLVEYINLINIHFIISDLINKRKTIKDNLYFNYNIILEDEV